MRTENFYVILDVIGFRKIQGDSRSDVSSINFIVAINIELVSRTERFLAPWTIAYKLLKISFNYLRRAMISFINIISRFNVV